MKIIAYYLTLSTSPVAWIDPMQSWEQNDEAMILTRV